MTHPHTQTCAVAGFLNLFGDNWTLLIIREALYGVTRFKEFRANTGIAKNLLSDRLASLVAVGILEKRDIGERGTRYAYHLTEKGRALETVLFAVQEWGNEHVYGHGREPVLLVDRHSGEPVGRVALLDRHDRPLQGADVAPRPGPGASRAAERRLARISG